MNYELKEVKADDYEMLKAYFMRRRSVTCESVITDTYLWKKYYNTKYLLTQTGLLWLYTPQHEVFSTTPLCDLAHLKENFAILRQYFNEQLHKKLVLYLVDEETVNTLALDETEFEVREERMYSDYIYDAEKLRTLSGKAYHKKKNHVNGFLKEYTERFECRMLSCADKPQITEYLHRWHENRPSDDPFHRDEYELAGIEYVLGNCSKIQYKMFGVFVDGQLEAFSLGTYDEESRTAFIHVEKANPKIRGLYPFINQQFLVTAFPDAKLVNREDDMGLEGLRKAKLSYQPIALVKKYTIKEK